MCGGSAITRSAAQQTQKPAPAPDPIATTAVSGTLKDQAEIAANPTDNNSGVGASGGSKGGGRMTRNSAGTRNQSGRRRASTGLGL